MSTMVVPAEQLVTDISCDKPTYTSNKSAAATAQRLGITYPLAPYEERVRAACDPDLGGIGHAMRCYGVRIDSPSFTGEEETYWPVVCASRTSGPTKSTPQYVSSSSSSSSASLRRRSHSRRDARGRFTRAPKAEVSS